MARALRLCNNLNTTPFVRIIPTDKCNLNCFYCWQHNNKNDEEMTKDDFVNILKKAKQMKVGIMTFLGGEPLMWEHLYYAIRLCSNMNILTDLTTNGKLLNENTIFMLASNGLDHLNISVDGLSSVKDLDSITDNLTFLNEAKKQFGMITRVNSVVHKNNISEIKFILEYLHANQIPMSIGYIMPPLDSSGFDDIYFTSADKDILDELIEYLHAKFSSGYSIIEPLEYYANIYKYLNREKFWNCNYPGPYGWINVISGCRIRSCTKKMDVLNYNYLELTENDVRKLKKELLEMTEQCNAQCYSNCAFDSSYFVNHKRNLLKRTLLGKSLIRK